MKRKTSRSMTLTQSSVKALENGTKARIYFYDDTLHGLAICVSPSGAKTWYWVGRLRQQPTRICLGKWPEVPVDRARQEAKRIVGEIADGKVPTPRRRTVKQELSLGDVFLSWFTTISKPRKRTWETDQRRFDRVFSPWKHRPLSSITTDEVNQLHIKLAEESGVFSANKMLELFRTLYRHAAEYKRWHGVDPSKVIKRFPVRPRDRFLNASEMGAFFAAVAKLQRATARDFIMLCLFTGARRSNVQMMEWSEIDWDRRTWTIPHFKAKEGEPIIIALSAPAVAILERRRSSTKSKWVLPGHGKNGYYCWPKETWTRVLKLSGISDLRLHDLRRTLGSWQALTGASMITIAKSLGHSSVDSTAIYARLQVESTRQAVDDAIAAMMAAAQKNQ